MWLLCNNNNITNEGAENVLNAVRDCLDDYRNNFD
jgi:ribulose bisphosphate carboxylase small subunit